MYRYKALYKRLDSLLHRRSIIADFNSKVDSKIEGFKAKLSSLARAKVDRSSDLLIVDLH